MWVLGVNLQPSERSSNALNHWIISPFPNVVLVLKIRRDRGDKLRLCIMWQGWGPEERHWWGCSVSSNGDARTLEITIAICNHCKRQQQMWGEGWPVSVKYAICSLSGRDREVEWGVHALRSPENCKYILDIKHFLYCRSLDVLWFDCDCTMVLPLWSKRYLIWILFLLLFYKSPQLRDFGLWKRHWILKENLGFFFTILEFLKTVGLLKLFGFYIVIVMSTWHLRNKWEMEDCG